MCMEQNEIGFITVAICGGYIGKYPRLLGDVTIHWNGNVVILTMFSSLVAPDFKMTASCVTRDKSFFQMMTVPF